MIKTKQLYNNSKEMAEKLLKGQQVIAGQDGIQLDEGSLGETETETSTTTSTDTTEDIDDL